MSQGKHLFLNENTTLGTCVSETIIVYKNSKPNNNVSIIFFYSFYVYLLKIT